MSRISLSGTDSMISVTTPADESAFNRSVDKAQEDESRNAQYQSTRPVDGPADSHEMARGRLQEDLPVSFSAGDRVNLSPAPSEAPSQTDNFSVGEPIDNQLRPQQLLTTEALPGQLQDDEPPRGELQNSEALPGEALDELTPEQLTSTLVEGGVSAVGPMLLMQRSNDILQEAMSDE